MSAMPSAHLDTAKTTGAILIVSMMVELVWANSPWREMYQSIHHLPVHIRFGPFGLDRPLVWWINEGLMVPFFLLVGLEIKREVLSGRLSSWRLVTVPAVAALAGMIFPAAIYLVVAGADPVQRAGWAIPTATDIVLVLGLLAFLGDRVSITVKVFLTALAMFDDIGAVLIIGLFYGHGFSFPPLAVALTALILAHVVARFWRFSWTVLALLSVVLWGAILEAGIEGAIAGVLIGILIPFERERPDNTRSLNRVQSGLRPWVFWAVIPVFALFNTGIDVTAVRIVDILDPVAVGVFVALVVGKPAGILGSLWILDRLGMPVRQEGLGWGQLVGASMLAGVGFTMSIFIASIAFIDHHLVTTSKLSILAASLVSALLGFAVLRKSAELTRSRSPGEPR